ncbi:MAG: hypothetical protein ACRDF4_04925, partial [Rhabdochlamydiaceae bacterium]
PSFHHSDPDSSGICHAGAVQYLTKAVGPLINNIESHVATYLGTESAIFMFALGLGIWKG